jgi:hypothetical protein
MGRLIWGWVLYGGRLGCTFLTSLVLESEYRCGNESKRE